MSIKACSYQDPSSIEQLFTFGREQPNLRFLPCSKALVNSRTNGIVAAFGYSIDFAARLPQLSSGWTVAARRIPLQSRARLHKQTPVATVAPIAIADL